MARRYPKTLEEIEQTPWAKEFKLTAPTSYKAALKYAMQERLEVSVKWSDEAGFFQWVIRVEEDPEFWMDAKPTKAQAVAICRSMGWRINK